MGRRSRFAFKIALQLCTKEARKGSVVVCVCVLSLSYPARSFSHHSLKEGRTTTIVLLRRTVRPLPEVPARDCARLLPPSANQQSKDHGEGKERGEALTALPNVKMPSGYLVTPSPHLCLPSSLPSLQASVKRRRSRPFSKLGGMVAMMMHDMSSRRWLADGKGYEKLPFPPKKAVCPSLKKILNNLIKRYILHTGPFADPLIVCIILWQTANTYIHTIVFFGHFHE